ncbi:beta-ketoacyl-[acyl-carrier-protein] synthase family protein [Actinomadura terrae]|uniref:beta-ketoacyl-[acyl-carrier-protein] synthase family protein n=1 Tax=Actinomadura terrae TaxID=604353 RepID=UPI001FA74536|nr:beta-ketoacyl-[acyl-carrier-protein] synthase family protein [Actinomadura terrae]
MTDKESMQDNRNHASDHERTSSERGASEPGRADRRRRVVITGLGVKTPAGCDLKTFTKTIFAGMPTAAPATRFDTTGLPSKIACQVDDFDPGRYMSGKELRRTDRTAQLGFAAAMDAVADAGQPSADHGRAGIVSGVALGGMQSICDQALVAHTKGGAAISPMSVPKILFNAPGALISQELAWRGPNITIATACASGSDAIGMGARYVQDGTADVILAGACDSGGVTLVIIGAFGHSGGLSTRNDDPAHACRPFDADRDGYIMGEGAAYLVLEERDRALARGAHMYGEVIGYASGCDAHHITAPQPQGRWTSQLMMAAISDAGLVPDDIRQVNCHATGTPLGDAAEAAALRAVFADRQPPVTSCKGVFGHLVAASGAAEAAVAALSARDGLVPPTAGHERLGADCHGIDVVAGEPRRVAPGPALSNSFGLGGQNASIVLAPPPQD